MTDTAPITHIIHLADIHIRTGNREQARIEEYEGVFERLWTRLCAWMEEDAARRRPVMVVCGDIFHNKGRLETEGATLWFRWLNRFLSRMPVVVICGNHDYRQEDADGYTDMIQMMVTPYAERDAALHELLYLERTGVYPWRNLVWGHVSIKDCLVGTATVGRLATLPDWPLAPALAPILSEGQQAPQGARAPVARRIALFHGSIGTGAHEYPIEWVARGGWDWALLGDMHERRLGVVPSPPLEGNMHIRRQDTTARGMTWAYPGSLVQQNWGEAWEGGHGPLIWDVATGDIEAWDIPNPFGFVTVSVASEGIRVRSDNGTDLEWSADVVGRLPARARVRVMCSSGGELATVRAAFERAGLNPLVYTAARLTRAAQMDEGTETLQGTAPVDWRVWVGEKLGAEYGEWLRRPEAALFADYGDVLPEALAAKTRARNTAMRKAMDAYHGLEGIGAGGRGAGRGFRLHRMAWQYLMCYGAGCVFDFDRLREGAICLLNGPNASGKSSFLDVVCLALYGEPTLGRRDIHGKKHTDQVIYTRKPVGAAAMCEAVVSVAGSGGRWRIRRAFGHQQTETQSRARAVRESVAEWVTEGVTGDQGAWVERYTSSKTVEAWVAEHLGTLEEFLMGSVLCQTDTVQFLTRGEKAQRELLDRAYGLESLAAFQEAIHEGVKAYRVVCGDLEAYRQGMSEGTVAAVDEDDVEACGDGVEVLEEDLRREEAAVAAAEAEAAAVTEEVSWLRAHAVLMRGLESPLAKADDAEGTENVEELSEAEVREILERYNRVSALSEGVGDWEGEESEGDEGEEDVADPRPEPVAPKWGPEAIEDARAEIAELESVAEAVTEAERVAARTWRGLNTAASEERADEAELGDEEAVALYSVWCGRRTELETLRRRRPLKPDVDPETFDLTELVEGGELTVGEVKEATTAARGIVDPPEAEEPEGDEAEARAEAERWRADVASRAAAEARLAAVEKEQSRLEATPFNPDCWACCQGAVGARRRELEATRAECEAMLEATAWILETEKGRGPLEQEAAWDAWNAWSTWVNARGYECAFYLQWERRVEALEAEVSAAGERLGRYWARACERVGAAEAAAGRLGSLRATLAREERRAAVREAWERARRRQWRREGAVAAADYERVCAWAGVVRARLEALEAESRAVGDAVRERRDVVRDLAAAVAVGRETWARLKRECAAGAAWRARAAALEAVASEWAEVAAALGAIEGVVGGGDCKGVLYRDWIYPRLEAAINDYVGLVDAFRVRIRCEASGAGAATFWIEDRGHVTTVDHASGYQRFVIGLGVRQALLRQGALQRGAQMFMDEGFVSLDARNVAKIPAMLGEWIRACGTRHVVLMSHMEAVREVSEVCVPVVREGEGPARLVWGETEAGDMREWPDETPARGGRRGRGR